MRRGHPLLKALGGVAALLLVGAGAAVGGVRVVQDMINENGKSRLELFTDGTDRPTIATIGDPSERIRVELPSPPLPSSESMTFLTGVLHADRRISPAGTDGAVQILWFRVIPDLARNPEFTLSSLATAQASNLGGTGPLDKQTVSTGTVAAYDFRVRPQHSVAGGSDYYVRILMRGNVVYVLRVEAKKGGRAALLKVANSIRWVLPARRTA